MTDNFALADLADYAEKEAISRFPLTVARLQDDGHKDALLPVIVRAAPMAHIPPPAAHPDEVQNWLRGLRAAHRHVTGSLTPTSALQSDEHHMKRLVQKGSLVPELCLTHVKDAMPIRLMVRDDILPSCT